MTAHLAPAALAVPYFFALIVLGRPRARWVPAVTLAGVVVQALVSGLLARHVWLYGPRRYTIGGWGAPLGIELHLDGLAVSMTFVTAMIAIPLTTFAISHYGRRNAGPWRPLDAFWPCWLFLLGSLAALYLSADIFNLYITLELLTLASVALVVLGGDDAARRAATRYLFAAFLGSMAYLLAVALVYGSVGALDLAVISERIVPGPAAWGALALAIAALALKGALFPLHFWLPGAHSTAPAPVSGMLSGFVVASAFYILLRLWFEAFNGVVTVAAAQAVGALGAAAIVWGSLQAIRQQRLKLMIAYSTVAQVGYFALCFPLAAPGTAMPAALDAWRGSIYLVLSHACAKAAMFLAAGTIARSLGHDRIVGISGIAARMPVATYAFGIAGISLIGLPPSGGFVGKWLLLSSSIASGQWWWTVVIIVGGILTAGYVFLVLGQELSQAEHDIDVSLEPVPRTLAFSAITLAFAALLLGVRAVEPLELLTTGGPFGTGVSRP